MKRCQYCAEEIQEAAIVCRFCGRSLEGSPSSVAATNRNGRRMVGLAGCGLLFLGVFMPVVNLPIVGSMNYFQNGKGDGTIILVLSLIALLFIGRQNYRALWVPGVLCLALLGFAFFSLQSKLSEMKDSMNVELAGNPFRGIADAMAGTIQLQWGWAVLVLGAGLLLGAAFMRDGGAEAKST